MRSRHDILLENYSKVINIEALTMIDMVKKYVISAVMSYSKALTDTIISKKSINVSSKMEEQLLNKISALSDEMYEKLSALEKAVDGEKDAGLGVSLARYSYDCIVAAMEDLRTAVDELESLVAHDYWPLPTYSEMLFSVM